MKGYYYFAFLLAIVGILATGCSSCHSGKGNSNKSDYDGVVQNLTEVENVIALHRQTMNQLVGGKKYCWYETSILFNDSINADNLNDLHVVDVTDVFQTFNPNLCQKITTNVKKGTLIPAPVPDIWIEDVDMSYSEIKLTVKDVLQRLSEWNGIIPLSIGITLRTPLGPKACNPQYVIGNIGQVIFVDAVTGDITDWCPAFPKTE